jgi:hypothetical protein
VLIKENAKMRELQRGARKDAMIPTGRKVIAEEVGSSEGASVGANVGLSQDSVEMVNTPSTVSTEGCSLAPMIFKNGEVPAYSTRARSEYGCKEVRAWAQIEHLPAGREA